MGMTVKRFIKNKIRNFKWRRREHDCDWIYDEYGTKCKCKLCGIIKIIKALHYNDIGD